MGFLIHTAVSAVLLFIVGRIASGIEVRDGKVALFGALGLGLANAFVRPLLVKLTLPISVLTLGLFVWVINALILVLVAEFVDGFEVEGFKAALWGSAALGLMNFLVGMLL
jgi:putative membrane protein